MTQQIDMIPVESVRINGGTQSRVELNQATISEYAESIRLAVDLPPVVVFFDGATFWLADGFHRFHAHREAGAMEIAGDIHTGTQRDAILYSVGANAAHGLRRTNADKRRAVETLLNDAEWAAWSGNQIAKACAVSESFVRHLRLNEDTPAAPPIRIVERNGKTYEQNTTNIGRPVPRVESDSTPAPKSAPTIATPRAPESAPGPVETIADEPDAAPAPEPEIGDITELREKVAELSDLLQSTLADNEMMGRVFDADDQIKAAMAEATRQRAIAENAERTLIAKNGEFVERARAVTYWQNRATKAEKALEKLEPKK
jgi:hypothetical protein